MAFIIPQTTQTMIQKYRNTTLFIVLGLLSVTNLLVMHYSVYQYAEVPFDITSYFDNVTGILFDIIIVFSFFMIVFRRVINKSLLFCYFTTFIWALANILYSRFFFQYISLSSMGQVGNLINPSMVRCMIEGFYLTDLLFIISLIISIWTYHHTKPERIGGKKLAKIIIAILCIICSISCLATIIHSIPDPMTRSLGYVRHHLVSHHFNLYRNSANPNWTYFHRGSFRTLLQPQIRSLLFTHELTSEQMAIIEKEINNQNNRVTRHNQVNPENVIIIIVESYLSITSDLTVDGKEITPNLNRLKHSDNVYYNGHMKSNITIGESGDGQFICMTGLLPLRSEITVGRAKNVTLPGLPQILAHHMHLNTRMLIPTSPSMWEQERMCNQYGISKLYSSNDFNKGKGDLNDDQLFKNLQSIDRQSKEPFFSIVLTMSMHQPYTNQIDPSFNISDPKLSIEYINYLNACHYTDHHIGSYLNFLKDCGLFEKSLIVITSDHAPNPNSLPTAIISKEIPLYIINANIKNDAYTGPCQQIDIYTTILDILVKDKIFWRGLGNTLLSQKRRDITTTQWDISEWILQSDYFKNRINK